MSFDLLTLQKEVSRVSISTSFFPVDMPHQITPNPLCSAHKSRINQTSTTWKSLGTVLGASSLFHIFRFFSEAKKSVVYTVGLLVEATEGWGAGFVIGWATTLLYAFLTISGVYVVSLTPFRCVCFPCLLGRPIYGGRHPSPFG